MVIFLNVALHFTSTSTIKQPTTVKIFFLSILVPSIPPLFSPLLSSHQSNASLLRDPFFVTYFSSRKGKVNWNDFACGKKRDFTSFENLLLALTSPSRLPLDVGSLLLLLLLWFSPLLRHVKKKEERQGRDEKGGGGGRAHSTKRRADKILENYS